jgi:hypothetical protein
VLKNPHLLVNQEVLPFSVVAVYLTQLLSPTFDLTPLSLKFRVCNKIYFPLHNGRVLEGGGVNPGPFHHRRGEAVLLAALRLGGL